MVKNEGALSKRSKHIDVRYFFVRERIADQDVSVDYLQTNLMLADILTKPLQNPKFAGIVNQLMNGPGLQSKGADKTRR